MTTPKPLKQPTPVKRKQIESQELVEIRRTFTFLTPLFGGGVSVDPDENKRHLKEYDKITPVRGSAIRGQLRFWWRATHGLCPPRDGAHDLFTLRTREDALWGNASIVSKVNLRVEGEFGPCAPEELFDVAPKGRGWKVEPKKAGLGYAAFPLQPKSVEEDRPAIAQRPEVGKVHLCSGCFELILTCPAANQKEVEDAMDAWLHFGGLGGRTRRGFGAICSTPSSQNPKALFERLKQGLQPIHGVAGFANARLALRNTSKDKGMDALNEGLEAYRKFRQSRSKPPYGPSHWPEPEAIRTLTGYSHARYRGKRPIGVNKFPRAAFGLPIIFHFKDAGEPVDTALNPEGRERRASPMILRPFRNAQGRHDMLALVLYDPSAANEPCSLKEQKDPKRTFDGVQTALTPDEATRIQPLRGNTDVLQAFLDLFKR